MKRRRLLRLLVLVEAERMLHLITETLALGRVAVAAVFFLVDIAAAAALRVLSVTCISKRWRARTPVWKFS